MCINAIPSMNENVVLPVLFFFNVVILPRIVEYAERRIFENKMHLLLYYCFSAALLVLPVVYLKGFGIEIKDALIII